MDTTTKVTHIVIPLVLGFVLAGFGIYKMFYYLNHIFFGLIWLPTFTFYLILTFAGIVLATIGIKNLVKAIKHRNKNNHI